MILGVDPFDCCRESGCFSESPGFTVYNMQCYSKEIKFCDLCKTRGWTIMFHSVGGAMLLGLHIMRELDSADYDYVHYAIYSVSGLVGLIVMVPALFNIYAINYKKGSFFFRVQGFH